MSRVAALDIGTNAMLLAVAEATTDGDLRPLLEGSRITRLGRDVDRTGELSNAAIDETVTAAGELIAQARALGVQDFAVSASSAARDARNVASFLTALRAATGLGAEVLTGDREAHLTQLAVRHDFPEIRAPVVIDVGGGSTEFAFGRDAQVVFCQSVDLGSVRLYERFGQPDRIDPPLRLELEALAGELLASLPSVPEDAQAIAVAGTATTACALALELPPSALGQAHGRAMSLEQLAALTDHLCRASLAERRAIPGLDPRRADVLPFGTLLLLEALRRLGLPRFVVSDRGVRWGLLLERWDQRARVRR